MKLRTTHIRLLAASAVIAALPVAAGDYSNKVLSDSPKAYYRFGDDTSRSAVSVNVGSAGAAGNATVDLGVTRAIPGAIAGDRDRAAFFDFNSRTEIPWTPALNPPANQPFTMEAWFYPTSDQINGGQCPVNNRYAYSGVNRQGWVIFQRNPDESYNGKPGSEGIGWNFRMFRGSGGSSGLDVTSDVPYKLGKWTHVAVVYEPGEGVNASLTMYIDGVAAKTNLWTGGASGSDPGYAPNTNDHPESEAPNGPASLALGNYNNTASSLNPYFGGVDEFAFYSAKLSPEQILAHYQNGTNANRSVAYPALIQSHSPAVYLRLNEQSTTGDTAINLGDLRATGIATHTAEVRHPVAGADAGDPQDGAAGYHYRNGNSTTSIPYIAENNPNAGTPFTFEMWVKPASDRQGGQCPVNNRWVGGTGRTGWVIFQRAPNRTYFDVPGINNEGHGWNFRMFSGAGNGGQDVLTGTDYRIGEWQHLVFTWEPQTQNGDVGENGNDQWEGVLTAYVNGVAVASNAAARYSANRAETETGAPAADLGIGSYNAASGIGSNPYEGDIDEVALYTGYVLTPDQILAHYQTGTNAHPATPYASLVLSAGTEGAAGTQRLGPKTYLRFSDPASHPVANSGTLGSAADGHYVPTGTDAVLAGPQSPALAGFEASNPALPFDGLKQYASLNNPAGLNLAGQITLETWIKPAAAQGESARIVSHGPPVLSSFVNPPAEDNASWVSGSEVFLKISEAGTKYTVGSSDGTNTYSASAAIPAGDLGSATWIHLVGTYDGSKWHLYRNGTEIASEAAPVGALPVPNADWAIGSTGEGWEQNYEGGIDEVAIYGTALSADQVKAHYVAGSSGVQAPPTLAISRGASSVTITYTNGTLQEATTVGGSYSDVNGASSPYTVPAGTAVKFYRVRQ